MNPSIDALFIFCEGPHDSAFLKMILGKVMGYTIRDLKFSEMPSPFHHLFETSVRTHAAQDMSLGMAHKFFLPDTVFCKENRFIFLFNSGGQDQYLKIQTLLSKFLPLYQQAKTFARDADQPVAQSVAYLFSYDADHEGIDQTAAKLKAGLESIDDTDFLAGSWQKSNHSDFARTMNDKAIFVWANSAGTGTLEDILLPLFLQNDNQIMQKAEAAMTEMFEWKRDHPSKKRAVAESAKFQKAVLTTAGQRKTPGSSLNVVLAHSKMITTAALKSWTRTSGFYAFLQDFFEQTGRSDSDTNPVDANHP